MIDHNTDAAVREAVEVLNEFSNLDCPEEFSVFLWSKNMEALDTIIDSHRALAAQVAAVSTLLSDMPGDLPLAERVQIALGGKDVEADNLRADIAAKDEEIGRLREALEALWLFFKHPGESENDRFERIGEAFYADTMMLRPGKSEPAETDYEGKSEKRQLAFDEWCMKKQEIARKALEVKP